MVPACLRIVEEAATIGKAVGRDVQDAHNLRLVEPDGPRSDGERRVRERQIRPLRFPLRSDTVGQARQRFRHRVGRGQPAFDDPIIAPQDHGKAAGIDHAARQPDRIAMFGLRTGGETDGADIDAVGHVARPVLTLATRFAVRSVRWRGVWRQGNAAIGMAASLAKTDRVGQRLTSGDNPSTISHGNQPPRPMLFPSKPPPPIPGNPCPTP